MNLRYTIIIIVTFSRVKSEKNRFFLDEKNSRIENCGKKKAAHSAADRNSSHLF